MTLNKYENKFFKLIENIDNDNDRKIISEAYNFAKKAHKGQKRKSGEPYIIHPISVSISLWKKFQNIDLFISGLLHDTVEDCDSVTIESIYKKFGDNVGFIVDAVTKTEKTFLGDKHILKDERCKILTGGLHNIGCILLKLADREHNLATLSHMPKHKQIKKSFESQALYLPLIKILKYNQKDLSIDKSQKLLDIYLKENNIKTSKELKNNLLNICFHDFSEDIFDIVYNNSSNVVWEIEDKKVFDSLVLSGWFDSESVDIKKIESDGNSLFKVYFIFNSGSTFDSKNGKISILNSNFIS